jgi:hypothetical protein
MVVVCFKLLAFVTFESVWTVCWPTTSVSMDCLLANNISQYGLSAGQQHQSVWTLCWPTASVSMDCLLANNISQYGLSAGQHNQLTTTTPNCKLCYINNSIYGFCFLT